MSRSLITRSCLLVILVLMAPAAHPVAAAPRAEQKAKATEATKPGKAKIVLVGTKTDHPYASHMYQHECRLLATCLSQTPNVEAVIAQDWPDAKTLDGARAIVYYSRPAGDIVLDPHNKAAFQKLMADGVGYTAIHWATGADKKYGAEYRDILGGWFTPRNSPLSIETRPLERAEGDHPIFRGWEPFKLHDEFYCNLDFHPHAKPLLRVTLENPKIAMKRQIIAWTFERPGLGHGRSFGVTLGHYHENFGIPAFRKLLVNGILWTAKQEIPAAGAPVEVTTADLELSPPPATVPKKKK